MLFVVFECAFLSVHKYGVVVETFKDSAKDEAFPMIHCGRRVQEHQMRALVAPQRRISGDFLLSKIELKTVLVRCGSFISKTLLKITILC